VSAILSPGSYWIVGICEQACALSAGTSMINVAYAPWTFNQLVPDLFPAATISLMVELNLFVTATAL
jgi:hypothetical protein